MKSHPPFEGGSEQHRAQRLEQIARRPLLVASDPQNPEAEVIIHTDDVGVLVVPVVVRGPPVRRGPDHVPFPRRGMDFRVVHPVPLTVDDVVGEFHVLDAFGHRQRDSPEHPSRPGLARADDSRAAISKHRWKATARRMYSRSFVPSESSMSQRIVSNSAASASISASVRWAYSGISVMAIEAYRPDAGSPGGPARKGARDGQLNSWGMCVYTCFIGSTPSV